MEAQANTVRRGRKPNPHTRDNLVRAGVKMLHENGYTATGIKDIVAVVKVPKGSFYNYFESKEAFGAEVADFYFSSNLDELRALLENETVPPLERLQAYFAKRIQGFREAGYVRGCLLGNLSLEIADHSDPVRTRIVVHLKTWSGLFENCIARAQASDAIANRLPAATLASFVLNSWEGALLRMRAEKSDVPLMEFIDVIFGSVLV